MLDCKGHSLHLWLHSFDFCAGLGALCASVKFIALAFADYCRRNLGQCCVLSQPKTCSHVIGLTRLSLSITGRFSSVQFPRAFSRLLSLWRGGCEAKDLHTSRHHDCVPLTLAWYFQDLFFLDLFERFFVAYFFVTIFFFVFVLFLDVLTNLFFFFLVFGLALDFLLLAIID